MEKRVRVRKTRILSKKEPSQRSSFWRWVCLIILILFSVAMATMLVFAVTAHAATTSEMGIMVVHADGLVTINTEKAEYSLQIPDINKEPEIKSLVKYKEGILISFDLEVTGGDVAISNIEVVYYLKGDSLDSEWREMQAKGE